MSTTEAYTLSQSDADLLQRYGWDFARSAHDDGRTDLPLVTIGILCFNRCEDVLRTLCIVSQHVRYPNKEIIVIDNASTDATAASIRRYFPDVTLVVMSANIATAARNEFITRANGKYVVCLDDDSVPGSATSITDIVTWMEMHPHVSILSTRCVQPRTGIDETRDFEMMGTARDGREWYEGQYLFECACCMRTDDVRAVGGYAPYNNWGAEGMELAMRMHMAGCVTAWHPKFLTLHLKQWSLRPRQSSGIWAVRHRIQFFAMYFPWIILLPLLIAYTVRRALECVLHPGRTSSVLQGYVGGLRTVTAARRHSPKLTLRQALSLGRWYVGALRW